MNKQKYILFIQFLLSLFLWTLHAKAQNTIVRIEYSVDSMPDNGLATSIPISSATNITANFNLHINNLGRGFHTLFLRAQDQLGNWSVCQNMPFYRLQLDSIIAHKQINYLEYFVDTLTEFGSGTSIPLNPISFDNTAFNLPLANVSRGFHTLFLRAKDGQGNWSMCENVTFYRLQQDTGISLSKQISYLEYFIDTLTEFGSGISVPISSGSDINTAFNLPLTNVNRGFHTLFIRAKDMQGNWSISENVTFYRLQSDTGISIGKQISYVEYFIDTIPEYGSGVSVPVSPGTTINSAFNLPLANVSNGFHTLYFRAKDMEGNWSMCENMPFYKLENMAIDNISKVEYFLDNDPGFGNATNVTTADSIDVSNEIYLPLYGLPNGVHNFFARAKDSAGEWSSTQNDTIRLKFPPDTAGVISGFTSICLPADSVLYSVPPVLYSTSYIWTLPNGAIGVSDSNYIWVNFPLSAVSGEIKVKGHNEYGDGAESSLFIITYPFVRVRITPDISDFCLGETEHLHALVTSGGNLTLYQWYLNNLPVSNNPDFSFIPQEFDSVYCNVISDLYCLGTKSAQSEVKIFHQGIDRSIRVSLFLEGLFNNSTNMLNEAMDGNTGLAAWGEGIADKVNIELIQEAAPYSTLQLESDLNLSTHGLASFTTSCVNNGNYYIKVRNRNHIETWSSIPLPFNTNPVEYDFRYDAYQAFGGNPQVQVSANPALYAFYLGDLDQNGWVDADDFNMFEPDLTLGSTGFNPADFNGGGWVDADDFNMFEPRITAGNAAEYPAKK